MSTGCHKGEASGGKTPPETPAAKEKELALCPARSLSGRLLAYRRHKRLLLAGMGTLMLVMLFVSCFAGVAEVTPMRLLATFFPGAGLGQAPLTQTEATVLLHLRLPRIIMGLLAGVALALSGLIMQAITGNSMASPFTTGLSNAAALGASVTIVFGLRLFGSTQTATVAGAFVMAFLCAALVYGVSMTKGLGNTTIVLVGIALNYFFSALNSGMQYLADEQQLASIVNWTFGNLSQASWEQIGITGAVLLVCLPYIFSKAWSYNLLSTGDESALALGVHVGRLRLCSGLVVTLLAATVVSFTGVIGFVGLVAPHISRLLVGGDYRTLLPMSALLGGTLLVSADLVGRTLVSPVIIPVGIVVSFIGVPVFIYLILREKRGRLE